jgi:ABC-type amino acid transport system permease subunit
MRHNSHSMNMTTTPPVWEQVTIIVIGIVSLAGFSLFLFGTGNWATIALTALKVLWGVFAVSIFAFSKKTNKKTQINVCLAVFFLAWIIGLPVYFLVSAGAAVVLDYVFHKQGEAGTARN